MKTKKQVITNKLIWTSRYSETDEPDKHGRWARVAYLGSNKILGHRQVAWINRVQFKDHKQKDTVIFSIQGYFPHNTGTYVDKAETFIEAKKKVEREWNKFIRTIIKNYLNKIKTKTTNGK